MFVIEPVRKRHEPLVEPGVARLVAADQKYCRAPRIKGVEYPNGLSAALNAKLPHVIVARTLYPRALRIRQCRAALFQQSDRGGHIVMLALRKR